MGANEQGADATQGRWLTIPRTLCFVLNGSDVLLMKRGPHRRVFPNRYNGVGGHIERDEDPLTCARREIKEETGFDVHKLQLRAVYNIDSGHSTGIVLFVFVGESDSRDLTVETDEGTLHWLPVQNITDYDLVEDLPVLLPRILSAEQSTPHFIHASYDDTDQLVLRFAEDSE